MQTTGTIPKDVGDDVTERRLAARVRGAWRKKRTDCNHPWRVEQVSKAVSGGGGGGCDGLSAAVPSVIREKLPRRE